MRRALAWGVVVVAALLAYDRLWRPPAPAVLERLREERRTLSERLQKHIHAEVDLPGAGDAGVVIGIPAPLAERFARDASRELLSEVRLAARDLEIRKSGQLSARILVGRTGLGSYDMVVTLEEVSGVLKAGRPELRFEGGRVGVVLPVSLVAGKGRGRIAFSWDGRGVAGAVCGDLEAEGPVSGRVLPAEYVLRGGLTLTAEGADLVARPEFDDVELRLRVEPSPETWQLVEDEIGKQGAVCRTALRGADVPEKLQAAIDRGFPLKLPRRLLPDLRLPVEMETALRGHPSALRIRPAGLSISRRRVWYGTHVEFLGAEPIVATPTPTHAQEQTLEPPAAEATEREVPLDQQLSAGD